MESISTPIGKIFGGWTVRSYGRRGRRPTCICECACGKTQEVLRQNLLNGRSTRCRACADKHRGEAGWLHGHARHSKHSTAYSSWKNMKSRCTNKKNKDYPRYGGQGIGVSEAWRSFTVFLSDMGTPPVAGMTLEREDNSKGYEAGNVRWASRAEQACNRSTNVYLIHPETGERRTLAQWGRSFTCSPPAFKKFFNNNRQLGAQVLTEIIKSKKVNNGLGVSRLH